MSSSEIGIGIIGSGFMGRTHAEAFTRYVKGARPVAVAGGTRAPALAADYGLALAASPEDLLARPDVDAVVITTPHPCHAQDTILAARSGKHVLVEKPMALTAGDCDAMINACLEAHVDLMVAQTQRYRLVNVVARRLVEEGRLGPILAVEERQMDTEGLAGLPPWQSSSASGGVLLAHGVHNLDRMRWLVGSEPERVFARAGSFTPGAAIELGSMSLFTFTGGAMGTFWCEWECPSPGFPRSASAARVMGERGLLDLDAYGQLRLGSGSAWTVVCEQAPIDWRGKGSLDPVRMEAFGAQDQEFVNSILESRAPAVTGADGRAAVRMALAAYESSRTGESVIV